MVSMSEAAKASELELLDMKMSIEDAYVGTLRDIGESLVFYTPFDTGLSSSNWNLTGGSVPRIPERPVVEGIKGAASLSMIFRQSRVVGAGEFVTFYNPVDYIDDLERGTSPQSRAGMVTPTRSRIQDFWIKNLTKQQLI